MARIKQGILGGFSGRVGNVVGSSWKGIDVIKSMPLSVSNPKTTAQTNQRNKFAGVVNFASQINAAVIKPLNDRFALRQSGYNAFVARNIDNFAADGSIGTPGSISISSGKMKAPVIDSVSPGADTVAVSFDTTATGAYESADDEIYCCVSSEGFVSEVKDSVKSITTSRAIGSAPVPNPAGMVAGDTIYVWLSARRTDGTVVSNTSYQTAVAV